MSRNDLPVLALDPSLLCSEKTFPNKGGWCYVAAGFVLAAKVPCLRRHLLQHTIDFIDTLEDHQVVDADVCSKLPDEVVEYYTKTIKSSGSAFDFLQAILIANKIEFQWHAKQIFFAESSNDLFRHVLNHYEFPVSNMVDVCELVPTYASKPITVENLKVKLQDKSLQDETLPKIHGGLFSLKDTKRLRYNSFTHHVVAFTMCRGEVLLCDRGECKFKDQKRLDAYSVRKVLLLLRTGE